MANRKLHWALLSKTNPVSQGLSIVNIDTKVNTGANVHNLTLVQPGSLLVISVCNENNSTTPCNVSSIPALVWTPRVDAQGLCGNAEIYTAVFAAGGSIAITTNWGSVYQSSVCYTVRSQEVTLAGNFATAIDQSFPLVSINSSKANSIFICASSDWNVGTGTIIYRGSAIQDFTATQGGAASFYHYRYQNGAIGNHTVGMLAPDAMLGAGTAVLEIRSNTGGPPPVDGTPPSSPTITASSITQTSIFLSWTAATDNVGVVGYDLYVNGILHSTTTGLSINLTGLTPATTYVIVVRARDAAGNTTASNSISPTTQSSTDVTPPTAPVASLVGVTATTIAVSWTASTDNVGVTGYEVYLGGVLQITTTNLNYTIPGLTPETTYNVIITAKDAANNSTNSNTVQATTGASTPNNNVAFSFNEIPYGDPDIITYGRGAEQWHAPCTNPAGCREDPPGWDRLSNPTVASNQQWVENSKNTYHRFQWTALENATQGSFNWSTLDNIIENAIDNKQMISFGIMSVYEGAPDSRVSLSGINGASVNCNNVTAMSSYPAYIHQQMQALGCSQCDWVAFGTWIPNWNALPYINGLRNLHIAIRNRLLTRSYNGVLYADAVYCIDIRGYGQYGEWHSGSICDWNNYPTNRQPTAATLKAIIDAHTDIFDLWPCVMMVAGYNALPGGSGIPLFHPYSEVAHYALDKSNAWGRVGYRRDQVLSEETYLDDLLINNTNRLNGVGQTVSQKFTNLWTVAPGTGEPLPGGLDVFQAIQADANIQAYHHASFGNGNYGGQWGYRTAADNTSSAANRVRNAWKRCGFRLKITTGDAPQIITRNVTFNIRVNWINVGVACVYENWNVTYQLITGGGTVVWSGVSSKILKLFRPNQTVLITDTFVVTNAVSPGTYRLAVNIKDPKNYKESLKLAIQGQNADGSYTIFNSVTVN